MEKNCILDTNITHQVEEGKEEKAEEVENVVNLEENLVKEDDVQRREEEEDDK